jgi:hypothetical protein
MTSKNQITIPKKKVDQLPDTNYFEVELKDGLIVLKPLQTYETDLEKIRSKMKNLGLKTDSIREAIKWAKSK